MKEQAKMIHSVFSLIGLLVGVLSGIFGLQGTILLLPLLVVTKYFANYYAIIGTSLAALLLPVGIFGVIEYHKRGHVLLTPAIILAIFIAIGIWIGAYLSRFIHYHKSQLIAGFLCIGAGLYLIFNVVNTQSSTVTTTS